MSAAVSTTSAEMTVSGQFSTALTGLDPDSATALRASFETMFSQADEWVARAREIVVTNESQKREMKLARESRLALREIRINAEKARKRLKEDSLRRGKAIDGIANVLKALVEPIESYLLEQETFAERAEEARRDALRAARADALRAYGVAPATFVDLGAMDEDTWSLTIENARVAHEANVEAARQAELVRLEAERIAAERREAERQEAVKREAERAERERLQAAENERLKREAAARDAAAKKEREAAAAERARIEKAARAAQEAAEAEARKARAEAERVAAELAAERKSVEERKAAEQAARVAAELAPDREKLLAFARWLRAIEPLKLSTERGRAAGSKVTTQISKMADWISKMAESL